MYNGKVVAEKDGKFGLRVPGKGSVVYIRPRSPEEQALLSAALKSKEPIQLVRAADGIFAPHIEPPKT